MIGAVGLVACCGALGLRIAHKPDLFGTWRGYSYYLEDGALRENKEFGEFVIDLRSDGTYAENGNQTAGKWTRTGDKITLHPTHFFGMTPEQHRTRFKRSDGKPSSTIAGLLTKNMKPMLVTYSEPLDRLTYEDETLKYIYQRAK